MEFGSATTPLYAPLLMVALCKRETIYIFMLWFVLLMVALWNRETIYIFMLWFVVVVVLLLSFFFLA